MALMKVLLKCINQATLKELKIRKLVVKIQGIPASEKKFYDAIMFVKTLDLRLDSIEQFIEELS